MSFNGLRLRNKHINLSCNYALFLRHVYSMWPRYMLYTDKLNGYDEFDNILRKSYLVLICLNTMERWSGRVALVTGATSGIGEAVARNLTKHGMKVVGCGRRNHRLQVAHVNVKCFSQYYYNIILYPHKENVLMIHDCIT